MPSMVEDMREIARSAYCEGGNDAPPFAGASGYGTWEESDAKYQLEKFLAALQSKSSLIDEGAIADIAAERARQINKEGWTPEHDDKHNVGELAAAASCYAMGDCKIYLEVEGAPNQVLKIWPWDDEWWNPKDERRNLVRAGALIAAEIERLDRLAKIGDRP